MFHQKVIYKEFVEQLSELPQRFYSQGTKDPAWFHPIWPDNSVGKREIV
jgi:hypothetical protein